MVPVGLVGTVDWFATYESKKMALCVSNRFKTIWLYPKARNFPSLLKDLLKL